MILTSPWMFLFLVAVPILWALSRASMRRRRVRVASLAIWERVRQGMPVQRQRRLDGWLVLLLTGLTVAVVGAAGLAMRADPTETDHQPDLTPQPAPLVAAAGVEGRWLYARTAGSDGGPLTLHSHPAAAAFAPLIDSGGELLVELPTADCHWLVGRGGEPLLALHRTEPLVIASQGAASPTQMSALAGALPVRAAVSGDVPAGAVWLLGPDEPAQAREIRAEPGRIDAGMDDRAEAAPHWTELLADAGFVGAARTAGALQTGTAGVPLVTMRGPAGGRVIVLLDRDGQRVRTSLDPWGAQSSQGWVPLFVAAALRELTGRDVLTEAAWSIDRVPERGDREPLVALAGATQGDRQLGLYRSGAINRVGLSSTRVESPGWRPAELLEENVPRGLGWVAMLVAMAVLGVALAGTVRQAARTQAAIRGSAPHLQETRVESK